MDKTSKQGVYTRKNKLGVVSYIITYTINNKVYKKKVGTNLEGWTVNKAYKERLARVHSDTKAIEKKPCMTLDQAAEEYLASIMYKSDYKNTVGRYNNHIKYELGSIFLDKITVTKIHSLKQKLSEKISLKTNKKLAPKTVDDMINLVNVIYNYHNKLHRSKKVESPADVNVVERFKPDNARIRFLSIEEYQRLLWTLNHRNEFTPYHNTKSHVTDRLLLYVKLLVTTGVRTMSALTIRCKDINLEIKTIHIVNHKSKRTYTAYIHQSIFDELKCLCNRLSPDQYIFGERFEPLHRATLNKRLKPIMDKLFNRGVEDRKERVVVHTLRHTFGSWLVQQGTSLYIVSKLMDHTSVKQTQVYAKLLPNSGAEEVSKLNI